MPSPPFRAKRFVKPLTNKGRQRDASTGVFFVLGCILQDAQINRQNPLTRVLPADQHAALVAAVASAGSGAAADATGVFGLVCVLWV